MEEVFNLIREYKFHSIEGPNHTAYHKSLNADIRCLKLGNWMISSSEKDFQVDPNITLPEPEETDMSPIQIIKDFIEMEMGCVVDHPTFLLTINVNKSLLKDKILITHFNKECQDTKARIVLIMSENDCRELLYMMGKKGDELLINCDDFMNTF